MSSPQAIILAAGKGTRMPGDLAKVLHPVAEQPMLWWVIKACLNAGIARCVVVVGYQSEAVHKSVAALDRCEFVEQTELLGTGHAARMAEPKYKDDPPCDLFVLAGDGPLIRPQTLSKMLQAHHRHAAGATLATAVLDDPTGYGRIVRDPDGAFETIVEEKDATPQQREIREVNPSYYCFNSHALFGALRHIRNDNRQSEYYLTDVPAILKQRGEHVVVIDAVPPEDVLSINNAVQLAEVDRILRARHSFQATQSR